MPAGFGMGNHRMFMINFQEESLVGKELVWVQQFAGRRLNTKVLSWAAEKYVKQLKESIGQHRLVKRLLSLYTRYKHIQRALNKLDRQSRELMIHVEKKCRRIKSGWIPFLPEAALWIRQTQVYCFLLHYYNGKICNKGNLKHTACRCGIDRCFHLTVEEIVLCLQVCLERCVISEKTVRRIGRNFSQTAYHEPEREGTVIGNRISSP
jgi:hypothetical protein